MVEYGCYVTFAGLVIGHSAFLSERGPMTPAEIWEAVGVSKQGAMDLLNPLIEAGVVVRECTKKSGRYRLAT